MTLQEVSRYVAQVAIERITEIDTLTEITCFIITRAALEELECFTTQCVSNVEHPTITCDGMLDAAMEMRSKNN